MRPGPERLILRLMCDMRAISDVQAEMSTEADLRSESDALRADVAAEVIAPREGFGGQLVELRRAVIELDMSVVGRGVLISDLEARIRRSEQHRKLAPVDAH